VKLEKIKVGCIIILYNPDLELLNKVLESADRQVNSIYICDNSPTLIDNKFSLTPDKIVYEKMPYNLGIATAQNIGIKYY
jgi:rhamnosyltransferase